VVTPAGLGEAVITAALTHGGITRTASMNVTAYAGHLWDVHGTYDLNAPITTFETAQGDLTGYRYTAVVWLGVGYFSLLPLEGTYADLRIIGPGGDTLVVADTGSIISSIDSRGRLIVKLIGNEDRTELELTVASLTPEFIDGGFGCCGHISGAFTATRRDPE